MSIRFSQLEYKFDTQQVIKHNYSLFFLFVRECDFIL